MTLQEALAESDAPQAVMEESARLVELKAATREMGRGVAPPVIAAYVQAQFERAQAAYEDAVPAPRADAIARCEDFFRSAVG
jgi:hypothetical protein